MRKDMLSKLLLISIITLVPLYSGAQSCDCITQFSFVQNHYERNNPAFQKIRQDSKLYREYAAKVRTLNRKASRETSPGRCNVWLDLYVALLKDHHSGVDINLKRLHLDFNSAAVLDSFRNTIAYKSFKVVKFDSAALYAQLASLPMSDIEGIYTNGGSIIFGLRRNAKNNYTGLVLRKNSFLEVGHVLLELEGTKEPMIYNSIYNTGLLGFNFKNIYKRIEVKNGRIPIYGFYKVGLVPEEEPAPYSFRAIDAQTNYLQLTSFNRSLKDELNAFYKAIDSSIRSKPYLIIDLRNNGGGSEECYFDLMPYLYTKPFKIDDVEVWVSPDNIKQYEQTENKNFKLISRMKAAREYSFIPQVENALSEWSMVGTTYPRKVAVLYNRNTASSAENMITYCIQSSKVVTLGENSGGYLGYGDVMETHTPCGHFRLRSTTTKYKNNSRYEFVGIEPMIKLTPGSDWIEAAKKVLTE
ncbi:MAG TPA: S41 family peptidase [Chitinophagaceae bacterium]|nr:S41 family peptidase [Chitinophagaceae bacterium]